MIVSPAPVPPDEADRPEPPADPALVAEMLRQLDKTVRAYQLYLPNNPTYRKTLDALRASFAPIWAVVEELPLQVNDTQMMWYGVAVQHEPEKASDSLPWTLYKDGLREFTLTPGFEGEELEQFLTIIPRVRKAQDHEDDLITILWEQEFAHLTYRYVDVANDPGLPIDATATAGRWPVTPGEVVDDPRKAIEEARAERQAEERAGPPGGSGEEESLQSSPRGGIVSMEDFDSTLYFLDAEEIAYLRRETEREYAVDLRQIALSSLLDIAELQTDPLVRRETARNIEALTLHLLAGRQFANVAFLLKELRIVLERARDLDADTRAQLGSLPDRLSEPRALSQLLEAMSEASTLPPADELAELFAQLRPSALGPLLAWLGRMPQQQLRPLLEAAAERLASANTAELVKVIGSDDTTVSLEAMRRAGGLKTGAAVPALGKILADRSESALRIAAVTALAEIGTPGALQALDRALEDTDRDVRLGAIRALTQRMYKPALSRVTQLVKAREVREADRTERVAVFELYGALCGDAGVPFLDELLNGKGGFFSRREDAEIRACAAVALGRVGTAIAQQSLQKAMGEKDVVVRNAVNRALRGGGAA